jgi:type IV secretion system protein VirB4
MSAPSPQQLVRYPVFLGMTRPPLKFGITFGSFIVLSMGTMLLFLGTSSFWSLLFFGVGYPVCYVLCGRDPRIFSMLWVRLWGTRGLKSSYWGAKAYSPSKKKLPRTIRGELLRGSEIGRDRSVERFIPYAALIDAHTALHKTGSLTQVLEIQGYSFETRDADDLAKRTQSLNTLFRTLGPNISLMHHMVRRRVQPQLPGTFRSGYAAALNVRLQERLDEQVLFENVHYLSVTQRDPLSRAGAIGREARLAASLLDPAAAAARRQAQQKALEEGVSLIQKTLHGYDVRRLGMAEGPRGRHSEVLGFLSEVIHGETRRMRLTPLPLDQYLVAKRILFGSEAFEIRGPSREDVQLGAMLTIKEYAPSAEPGALDTLLRLPHPLVVTQSASLVSTRRARSRLKLQKRQLSTAQDDAVTLEDQLGEAIDAVASAQLAFAEHYWTVRVVGRTREELDEAVSDVTSALADEADVTVERSDLTLEGDFWSQLPGNEHLAARPALVSSACLACFMGFQGFARGRERSYWGAPVTLFTTTASTPYRFHLYHGDRGNTAIMGPNGSGKTVLLNGVLGQSQGRDPAPRTLLLDKDRGSEIFIRAQGGKYLVIRPGVPTEINPFAEEGTPRRRTQLCDLVACIVAPRDGRPLRPADRLLISEAIDTLYDQLRPEDRSLAALVPLLLGAELRPEEGLVERLQPYTEGDRSWVFGGKSSGLFDAHCVGIDMTAILGDDAVREVLGGYLFQIMDEQFDGRWTLGVIEEAWRYANDRLAAARISDWCKTTRKKNGAVIFCSQSPEDVIGTGVAKAVIAESPTQIWLPNAKASEEACCKHWGLTQREWEIVRTLPDTSRCFLVKQGQESVVVRFDLDGMEDVLTVLSGREHNVRRLDELRAEVGDDPNAWLPRLLANTSEGGKR